MENAFLFVETSNVLVSPNSPVIEKKEAVMKDCALHARSFEHLLDWIDQMRFSFEDKTIIADLVIN